MEEEDLQEMVMERHGKFEVLSAVDLQAAEPEEPEQQSQPTAPSEELEPDLRTTDPRENTVTLSGDQTESLTTCKEEDAKQTEEDDSGSTSSLVVQPDLGSRDAIIRDVSQEQENKNEQNDGSVQRPQSIDPTASCTPIETLPAVKAPKEQPDLKPKQQIRMQSAPGSSRAAKLAQQKREAEEERERKNKMSEAAFNAWVARKDEERRKVERERLKCATVGVSEKEKREMCDRVYQNWVEAKKRELKSQRLSRPTTSVPKKDEEQCRQVFESWFERKRTLHMEETKRERMKTQEMEESAKKADTSVIDGVYKE